MKAINETTSYFKSQFQLVLQARRTLFEYCETISTEDFLKENNSFGRGGSVRNLLVHIANTYEFWIVKQALKKDITFKESLAISTMAGIEKLFSSINNEIFEFLTKFESSEFQLIDVNINGSNRTIAAFLLFTHVITHEFHHKGQILSLSRHLGYIPVDTDIIR